MLFLYLQIQDESDALAALRRATEDAGAAHAASRVELGHHVHRVGPMWSEARNLHFCSLKDRRSCSTYAEIKII